MPEIHMQRRMRHSPDDMLALVEDVPNYPIFIDLISAVRVISRDKASDTKEVFIADVAVQYKFVSEQFRSQVNVDRVEKSLCIKKSGHGGAVRDLQNNWQFIELKDGSTLIDFRLNVRLKAAPLEFLIKQKIDKAARHIMNAFEKQAGQAYQIIGQKNYDFTSESAAKSNQAFI